MGQWREQLLLAALTGLAPLSSALEITSTFTTVFPTTSVVTSSSDIPGCTVASSMQIACSNGYYNTYGAVWQETCAASVSGGSLILSSTGLSLRACTSACAVRPACSAASFNSAINMCYLFQGDVTITPGGPYQAAMRYAPSASPCVSTWLVTETNTVTSTGETVYTVTPTSTPTPTPSATVISSSTPVSPFSTPISPSSVRVSASSSPVTLSSSSVSPSSTPLNRPSTISSSIILSISVSSPARPSSTPLIRTSVTSSGSTASPSVISSDSSSFVFSPSTFSSSSLTSSALGSSSSTSSSSSFSLSTSPNSSVTTASSDVSASGPNASTTQPAASSTVLTTATVAPSGSSPSTQSSEESSGSTPSASTYTVTTTQVQTITSCAAAVINCPAHQQTTYLTTETITYVTTVCPEGAQTTAPQATGSVATIPQTSVIQNTSASSAQATETAAPPSHMTTSTIYVTEIDVVTACPTSVHNCPAGQRSTYTSTKTVATYTTEYLVAATESAQVAQSMDTSLQPMAMPTLSLAQPHVPGHGSTRNTQTHALSSGAWKAGMASSSPTQAATHATTMNTVSGKTTSTVTASAPSNIFTGNADKMGHSSILFTMAAVLSTLIFL